MVCAGEQTKMRTRYGILDGEPLRVKTLPSDNILLQRIGSKKDRVAFEQLYTKHKRKAYSLAFNITGKQHLAEEAVQDAMLVVWQQADRFKPGNGRAWLLSVVAHKCLQLNQKKSRKEMALGADQDRVHDPKRISTEEHFSESEAAQRLKEMVAQLPASERSLLAMYYSGGLSQDHISKVTQTPQRTVSTQLKRILETLRLGMHKAGMAGAAVLLDSPSGLPNIPEGSLFELQEPPVALDTRIMQGVDSGSPPPSAPALGGKAQLLTYAFWGLGVVSMALLSVGLWSRDQKAAQAVNPNLPAKNEASLSQTNKASPWSLAAPQKRPFYYKWSFEAGPLENVFPVVKGTWKGWRPAKGNRPAARLAPNGIENAVGAILPVDLPDSKFRIRVMVEMYRLPKLVAGVSFCWVGPHRSVARYQLWNHALSLPLGSRVKIEALAHGSYIFNLANNHMTSLRKFQDDYPRRYLAMVAHNVAIQSIEIEELSDEQFPEAYRTPAALVSKVANDPDWTLEDNHRPSNP